MKASVERKIVTIVGTNASGKSSIGIKIALLFSGEIISADSRQVYRGFDLCSGKVTIQERKVVPHHLIDILDIGERYSVSQYQSDVYDLIPDIYSRGNIPIIVGGTGLYVDSITKGYYLPKQDPNAALRAYLESCSLPQLQAMLSNDALNIYANNVSEFQNKRRLIRMVEKERSGLPLTPRNDPQFDSLQLGVTWPQSILVERIKDRLTTRVNMGMINEVDDYLKNGGNVNILYSLGLEYKYIAWYLEGRYDSYNMFFDELSGAIRRFAKRQIKWFRRNEHIHWINMEGDYVDEAAELVSNFLNDSND